jgi:hypothetical protein
MEKGQRQKKVLILQPVLAFDFAGRFYDMLGK